MITVKTPLKTSHHLTIPFTTFLNFFTKKNTSFKHRNTKNIDEAMPMYLIDAKALQKSL